MGRFTAGNDEAGITAHTTKIGPERSPQRRRFAYFPCPQQPERCPSRHQGPYTAPPDRWRQAELQNTMPDAIPEAAQPDADVP